MTVEQIYQLMNAVTEEVTGQTDLVLEDLSNVVQIGEAILNATSYDNYVRTLVNHIGKVDFHTRLYTGGAPSIYKDSWEYGSVREKISFGLPDAEENPSWELQDGQSYDQDKFTKPSISVKFFNGRTTYQIPLSITERQVKESFSNVNQLNAFVSGLQVAVENAITIKNDALVMETINAMTAQTLHAGGAKAVNLLSLYNTRYNQNLDADDAVTDPDFIRFASYIIGLYSDRMTRVSNLFNIAGETRFTPKDKLHLVLLSEFAKAADAFLQSNTYHEQFTALPNAETVPFWQGSGQSYAFDSTSKINVTVENPVKGDLEPATITVEQGGILGVMFDDWAVGITNEDRRTTSHVNAVGEFTNYWYKVDAEHFNDVSENYVVFYIADGIPALVGVDTLITGCTASPEIPASVNIGGSISTTISPSDGYTLAGGSAQVLVGGEDVTATAYVYDSESDTATITLSDINAIVTIIVNAIAVTP